MAVVIQDANDAIILQDLQGKILAWNPAATRIFGWSEEEALRMNIEMIIPHAEIQEALAKITELSKSEFLRPYIAKRLMKSGEIVEVSITATVLVDEKNKIYAVATTQRKIQGNRNA
jgi:two-component system CheB/CheR fusion protein